MSLLYHFYRAPTKAVKQSCHKLNQANSVRQVRHGVTHFSLDRASNWELRSKHSDVPAVAQSIEV